MKAAVIPARHLITAAQLKAEFGIYPQIRLFWSKTRGFPRPLQTGGYRQSDVVAWLRANGWRIQVT